MNPVTAIVLFLSLLCVVRSSAVTSPPSPYEVLKSYNLPVGLLPKGAVGYDLDADTGEFAVRFNSTCSFSLQGSYQIRYQPTVTGRISDGRLRDLKGVSVKILFVWVNIVEVDRNGDQLEFSVGIASADFPVENFDECPQCGCGMDCGDASKEEEEETRRVKLRSQI
ncbi:uncharacterized protein M6B38_148680 [Iris pallida]|uniref:DUF538 family protein n=1 Tax=Iris pallida TaxID=29817 RepID=A0AAX6F8J8_IRIPA|nr:uncharacterized protein M6B38_148655 [Iris pallida]KAJ6812642.1 uncharacterized protein M6B38_148680 [Iris pallida]